MAKKRNVLSFRSDLSQIEAIENFKKNPLPFRVRPQIQHYDWGQKGEKAYLPHLLGIDPEEGKAYAELWIGAHPLKPAKVSLIDIDPTSKNPNVFIDLNDLIDEVSQEILGNVNARKFQDQLPFLMKVISASGSLSLQVHPDKQQARKGYEHENALGIPRNSESRNYKDRHHKPELLIALSEFYVLNQFRNLNEIILLWESVPEFEEIIHCFSPRMRQVVSSHACRTVIKEFYRKVMSIDQDDANRILSNLTARLKRDDDHKKFSKESLEYWVLKADRENYEENAKDRGLFSFYLLNLVHIKPGQAHYLGAGELHAYLEGVGVEVMANSDNVLRGGLTHKMVNLPELLKALSVNTAYPRAIVPNKRGVYRTPAREFEVSVIEFPQTGNQKAFKTFRAEIYLVLEGTVELKTAAGHLTLKRGETALLPAILKKAVVISKSSKAKLFRCTVPK